MNYLKTFLKISRPRFWMYTAGPWLLGSFFIHSDLSFLYDSVFWFGFIYFLIPANLLIYGINDWADEDTDKYNPKKEGYESKYSKDFNSYLYLSFFIILLVSVFFIISLSSLKASLSLIGFLLLSIFYSVKPVRFKSIPFLDSISNVLYIFPGLTAFWYFGRLDLFPWLIFVSAWFWSMGMHLFSALPDIKADKEAGVKTTAVLLGFKRAGLLCFAYFLLSAVMLLKVNLYVFFFILLVYGGLSLLSLKKQRSKNLLVIYKYFNYLNILFGFALFCFALLKIIYSSGI